MDLWSFAAVFSPDGRYLLVLRSEDDFDISSLRTLAWTAQASPSSPRSRTATPTTPGSPNRLAHVRGLRPEGTLCR